MIIMKIEKYQNLKKEGWIAKKGRGCTSGCRRSQCIRKGVRRWMDIPGITVSFGMVQKSILLGTARALKSLRNVKC